MNIEKMLNELIDREGGYSDDPTDRGGKTKYGITEAVARAHGYKGHMKDMPRSVAVAIYSSTYWTGPRFDQVAGISAIVAEELFDTGVNCGVGFAKPLLQRALNLYNNNGKDYADLVKDGIYGNETMKALRAFLKKRGRAGELELVKVLNGLQLNRYVEICERNPSQEKYFYGWIANRVTI